MSLDTQRAHELAHKIHDIIVQDASSGKGSVLSPAETRQLNAIAARLTGAE